LEPSLVIQRLIQAGDLVRWIELAPRQAFNALPASLQREEMSEKCTDKCVMCLATLITSMVDLHVA
jgi:hypothetical protein